MRPLTWTHVSVAISALLGFSACATISQPQRIQAYGEQSEAATERELVARAWNEYILRGGRHERSHTKVLVSQEGERVFIAFTLLPEHPGGFFEVTFDAKTGRVLNYLPGL